VVEVTKAVSQLCIRLEYMELGYRMLQLSCCEEAKLCVLPYGLLASDSLDVKGHEMPTCTLCIVTIFFLPSLKLRPSRRTFTLLVRVRTEKGKKGERKSDDSVEFAEQTASSSRHDPTKRSSNTSLHTFVA
jgi:hypothetical protein